MSHDLIPPDVLDWATEQAMEFIVDEAFDYMRAQIRAWLINPNRFTNEYS
jgi:hypothetical protein